METNAPSSASRPAGYAAIALASAAGVIAASRMSRPALALAAGLALAWWKKQNQAAVSVAPRTSEPVKPSPEAPPSSAPVITPEPVVIAEAVQEEILATVPIEPETENALEHHTPTSALAEIKIEIPEKPLPLPTAFPVAPLRPDAPITDAWNDLRAALSPTLGTSSKTLDTPTTFVAPAHDLPMIEAPEMPEMHFSMPSSPLLDMEEYDDAPNNAASDESLHFIPQPSATEPVGEIPDQVCLPTMTDEETGAHFPAPGFLVTDTPPDASAPAPSLFVKSFAPPVIVPKADFVTATDSAASETRETPKPLTAPIVVPREAQAKKSFFDWLRS